jgi:ABC-type sulfate/molybdate transport systems ATPase subunit
VEVHRRTGYLPGDLELFPRLTGRQHIAWFSRARAAGDDSLAWRLADRFQVVADRPVRALSKGNRQKIGLVLAFMHRPELLILDEPTSGLDPLMQREFECLLRETAAEGRTVFLSSHDLDEVQRTAGRIAIIKDGRLVAEDTQVAVSPADAVATSVAVTLMGLDFGLVAMTAGAATGRGARPSASPPGSQPPPTCSARWPPPSPPSVPPATCRSSTGQRATTRSAGESAPSTTPS